MTAALTLPELQAMMREAITDDRYQRETRLGSAVAQYLAWKKLQASARTLVIYEGYLARLCITLAHIDPAVDEVTPQMLLDALAEYQHGSLKIVRTSYSDFFKWACRWGHRDRNPVDLLPTIPDAAMKIYDVFTAAEQARLVASTDRLPLPWVQRLRVLCLVDLGIRKEEARLLRVSAFDAVGRVVMVKGKGGKERIVPLSDELWTAFLQFRNRRLPLARVLVDGSRRREDRLPSDDDYLFFTYGCSKAGRVSWTDPSRPISERGMHAWWRHLVDEAGVRYRSMHMARHSLATDLATAEVDSMVIKDWLGHADLSTTQVYVHNSRSRLSKGLSRLEEYRKAHG